MTANILKYISKLIAIIIIVTVPLLIARAEDNEAEYELSQGQINIVRRARQVMEIEWTPLEQIEAYGKFENFQPGVTYVGMPYGKPANGNHVPIETSFDVFMDSLNDIDSLMYTSNSFREHLAPYYALDCSSFVSWAWGLETVHKTWDFNLVAERIGTDIKKLEVGDSICRYAYHATLVTHVERDSDNKLIRVGIMEMNHPIARQLWFGEGESRPISSLNKWLLEDDFVIMRYRERDAVEYVHNCIVPIDNDFCPDCFDKSLSPLQRMINNSFSALRQRIIDMIEE